MKKLFSIFLCLLLLGGCGEQVNKEDLPYKRINQIEAKEMIDSDENIIILDVRTPSEYATGHIENSMLLPLDEIEKKAEEKLPDKDAIILVYCRSGSRSKTASSKLCELGYTNIYEFGGIITWPYGTTLK